MDTFPDFIFIYNYIYIFIYRIYIFSIDKFININGNILLVETGCHWHCNLDKGR